MGNLIAYDAGYRPAGSRGRTGTTAPAISVVPGGASSAPSAHSVPGVVPAPSAPGADTGRVYMCIDLKSFYASVECVARGWDPFEKRLVVADLSRGSGTICLAVSPAMKAAGVRNRCRVYEIPQGMEYEAAPPRMHLYMEVSAQIYGIYLRYISPDDIHVYSIDECFIDATPYLALYGKTPRELAVMLMDAVRRETGICATAGIGTNLFLAKVALDVTAKHAPDCIGYLDEEGFKSRIWPHRPITDIWNVGPGIARRLEKYGVRDLLGVAFTPEDVLYREFGVNAEFLIDHAWGREPCTIAQIKRYEPAGRSLCNGQVLFSDYAYEDAHTVVKEMVDGLVLDLVEKRLVTNHISLSVGYSWSSEAVLLDGVGYGGGSRKIPLRTNSYKVLSGYFEALYAETVLRDRPIRRINLAAAGLVDEDFATVDLFTDAEALDRERRLQCAILAVKGKYGKNALLKGMNFAEKATARERNVLIGGHRSGVGDRTA